MGAANASATAAKEEKRRESIQKRTEQSKELYCMYLSS